MTTLSFLAALPALLAITGFVVYQLLGRSQRGDEVTRRIMDRLRTRDPTAVANFPPALSPKQLAALIVEDNRLRQEVDRQDFELLRDALRQQFQLSLVVYIICALLFIVGVVLFAYARRGQTPAGPSPAELDALMQDSGNSPEERLNAFLTLRDKYGWRKFHGRELSGLTFPTAGWKDVEFTDCPLKGTAFRKANLRGVAFVRADLTGADLAGANLTECHFNGADLTGAKCGGADLSSAMLRYGVYNRADFTGATLAGATLTYAKFVGTNFTGADLTGANFNDNNPEGAGTGPSDLSGAVFKRAILRGADLRFTTGLESAHFAGAIYDNATHFPPGFLPAEHGLSEPAGDSR